MKEDYRSLIIDAGKSGTYLHAYLLLALTVVLLVGINPSAKAAFKCWTNNEGIRECGNVVPPEYAQQGHEVKSKSGLTIDSQGASRTIEEVEAEQARERLAAIEAEKAAAVARKKAAEDRVLLDTFSSEDDLLLARDGQISHLESQVKITESHIEKLDRKLEELIGKAADYERRGKEPPEKLVADIESLQTQVADNERFIANKAIERQAIREKFANDIERFRSLKGLADTQ